MGWSPGEPPPRGYRIRYKYNERQLIAGGSILAGSFVVTTMIAAGIATSGIGFIYAHAALVPVLGPFPVAAVGALAGIGPGTVGALLTLGVVQAAGFGVLIHGVTHRKPLGVVPECEARNEGERIVVAPIVSPSMAGISLGGAL